MTSMIDFKGKTALVTGAAGAIGRQVAADLNKLGATVFITDLDQAAVEAAAADVSAVGNECRGLAADVTREAQVVAVVAAAKEFLGGRIDILVNVAGSAGTGSNIEHVTEEEWEFAFAVNCKGSFFFVKHVVPLMKAAKYGKILNYSSKSGKTGSALMVPYSAAKGAIIAFTQGLAFELAKFNINVNCVCPGITDNSGVWSKVSGDYIKTMNATRDEVVKTFTSKVPLGRLANLNDVSNLTCFLCSDAAEYMTGQAINVTGGREMH
ncbi:MAG: SDR family oxidoreductase [Akkermansiaceae bacterium]|nr:SDR family oxidoreductase [Akkermansiaceae bacterium]